MCHVLTFASSPKCGGNDGHLIYKSKHGNTKYNMTDGLSKNQSPRCSHVRNDLWIKLGPLKGYGGPKLPSRLVHE